MAGRGEPRLYGMADAGVQSSEPRADVLPRVLGQVAGASPAPDALPPAPRITDAATADELLSGRGGRPLGPPPRRLTNLDGDPDAPQEALP